MEKYSTDLASEIANYIADWRDIDFPFQAKWFNRAGSSIAM